MDITNLALTGLVALGAVNVIGFFKPDLDSRIKFGISFLVAFGVTFIPADLAGVLAQNIKIAAEAALAASGVYKLSQNAGTKITGE